MYVVIMAGGKGERFWPCSRNNRPKQLLNLTGKGSMLQETFRRALSLVEPCDVYVVTTQALVPAVRDHLPDLPAENVIAEPVGRNTAPALGLAALWLERRDPEEVMLTLPADHYVDDARAFASTLSKAASVARTLNWAGTIGVRPTRPETGYGYIERGEEPLRPEGILAAAYPVLRFVEKPDLERAQQFLATGRFLWNSGMFIWKVSTLLGLIDTHVPDLAASLARIRPVISSDRAWGVIREEYARLRSVSVDYGIMERADSVFVVPAQFAWDDVGSWRSIERVLPRDPQGNAVSGNFVGIDARGLVVQAEKALVAAVGVSDLVIVESDGAILICAKDRTQDVRKVVAELTARNLDRYL